jgi:hypothetical protein
MAKRCRRPISIGFWRLPWSTQAPSQSTSTGQTRAQLAPRTFASRIVLAEPVDVAGSDLADEGRDVDVGGTCAHARRVEAVEAAVGLDYRGARIERRMQVWKSLRDFSCEL